MSRSKRLQRTGILLLLVAATLLALFTYDRVIRRPFPFISMTYTTDTSVFNGYNKTTPIPLTGPQKDSSLRYISRYLDKDGDTFATIVSAVKATRQIMSTSRGSAIRSLDDIVSTDPQFMQICSEASKVFSTLMQVQGRISRVVWMDGHTIAETYDPSIGWIFVDPYGNLFAKKPDGSLASITDIVTSGAVEFQAIVPEDDSCCGNYLGSTDKYKSFFFSQKLLVVINNEDLFSFHRSNTDLKAIAKEVFLAEDSVASGMQLLLDGSEPVGNFGVRLITHAAVAP